MRELILKMSMSLDGFVSDLEGRNGWMFGDDPAAKAWLVETTWNSSLHIMGSRSFRDMAAWWPTSTDTFAPPMNQIPKAVFSRQGAALLHDPPATAALDAARSHAAHTQGKALQPGGESWSDPHVASGDLATEIARLKAADGKPILAHGGVRFARSLVAAGLVDEFILAVHPVALGRGLPLFADRPAPLPLRLVCSTPFPGGAQAQIYRPA
ncbi:MAG: dihydrofolate reductase family protein [Steroidobacteraceae bacterium]|jgi:dihydrofolate reductase|nr:dihydrofolate reductase family protein [Steroidobacteraceae bacterium]